MASPYPLPTALKLLNGNTGHRPINHQEPKPEAALPERPAWLTKEAKAEWDYLAQQLLDCGCLALLDRALLARLCEAWADVVDLQVRINKLKGDKKYVDAQGRVNPLLRLRDEADKRFLRLAVEFGLGPSSRSKIKVDIPTKQKKSLGDFTKSRTG